MAFRRENNTGIVALRTRHEIHSGCADVILQAEPMGMGHESYEMNCVSIPLV